MSPVSPQDTFPLVVEAAGKLFNHSILLTVIGCADGKPARLASTRLDWTRNLFLSQFATNSSFQLPNLPLMLELHKQLELAPAYQNKAVHCRAIGCSCNVSIVM